MSSFQPSHQYEPMEMIESNVQQQSKFEDVSANFPSQVEKHALVNEGTTLGLKDMHLNIADRKVLRVWLAMWRKQSDKSKVVRVF